MDDKSNLQTEIADLIAQRTVLKDEIEQYKNIILASADGKPNIEDLLKIKISKIESTVSIMSDNIDKLYTFHKEIISPKEGDYKSQLDYVNEAANSILSDQVKAEQEIKVIDNLKTELFGDTDKNIIGQKQRIDQLENDLKNKTKNWEDNTTALFNKIEGLLPGATASGLAKAYQDQRISYNKPYWLWAIVFVLTLCGTLWFAIANLHDATSVEDAFMKVISRLPFFIPAFWLAIFASKQQSQNKRLQQEYAYKEALTKSYEADKRELEKLPDSNEKLRLSTKLLETMIDAAKHNPSETLSSKSHNDGPPSLIELFKLKMLKKLTGTDKPN